MSFWVFIYSPDIFYQSIEETRDHFPLNFPLIYWYLAKSYKSLNKLDIANKCHEKAKQILDFLANRISGKKDKETFFKVYFHQRIREDLV